MSNNTSSHIIKDVLDAFQGTDKLIGQVTNTPNLLNAKEKLSQLKNFIQRVFYENSLNYLELKDSVGAGNAAEIPWITIRSQKISKSTQEGIYLGLLIPRNRSGVYLALTQGYTYFKNKFKRNASKEITNVADFLRNQIKIKNDSYTHKIELGGIHNLSKGYEEATIVAKYYNFNSPPDDKKFIDDLLYFVDLYKTIEVLSNGLDLDEFYNSILSQQTVVNASNPVTHRPKSLEITNDVFNKPNSQNQDLPYTTDDIVKDGCFLKKDNLIEILATLQDKKNIILQGPPGTGKTWLAKKLAYALVGQKNPLNVKSVQFHPNLSYEDFIRGLRPFGNGKLTLVEGAFMEMVNRAHKDQSSKYVVVIEEINRGNPAQIFGEVLTLLEADKRFPDEAIELSYKFSDKEKGTYIPPNLYVIGTMNVADRSLALVDLALRRRFSFINLQPTFGEYWRKWMMEKHSIPEDFLKIIERKVQQLNTFISEDDTLGKQFCIGQSYLTPARDIEINNYKEWFVKIVKHDIVPLLEEYWYDPQDKSKVRKEEEKLLQGI